MQLRRFLTLLLPTLYLPCFSQQSIFVTIAGGDLYTLNLSTCTSTFVGATGQGFGDIAFTPDGKLWGIVGGELYNIDTLNATATLIGNTGIGVVSLIGLNNSTLLAEDGMNLYGINTTDATSYYIDTIGHQAAGDLTWYDNDLYLTTSSQLIQLVLNSTNTAILSVKTVNDTINPIPACEGTATTSFICSNNTIIGFSSGDAYKICQIDGTFQLLCPAIVPAGIPGAASIRLPVQIPEPVSCMQPVVSVSGATICKGETATIVASGGVNYSWSTGHTTSAIVVSPSVTTTYSVTTSNGCTAYGTVTVNQPPVVSVSGTAICMGEIATITASGNGNYLWSTGETTNSITVSPTVTTTYSLTVSNVCGSDTAFPKIVVFPNAVSQFSFNTMDADTCGSSAIQFTNHSIHSNSWLWNFGDGNSSILENPAHSYPSTGMYYITLISTNSNGCSDTSQQTIHVDAGRVLPLFLPNAFSPNGDNENDFFILQGTECMKKFSLVVYNRWGEKIFKTTYQSKGWDGTRNGVKENSGVYTYYLEATLISGEVIRKKGNVTLVR